MGGVNILAVYSWGMCTLLWSPLSQMKPYVEFNKFVLGKEVFIRCKLKSLYKLITDELSSKPFLLKRICA